MANTTKELRVFMTLIEAEKRIRVPPSSRDSNRSPKAFWIHVQCSGTD